TDQRAVFVEHARSAIVEIRTGRLGGAGEERLLRDRRAFAEFGMRARRDDLARLPDDLPPPRRVQFRQPLGEHGDVAGADLEEAVAAERAASAALQLLRLRLHDAAEKR